MIQGRRIEKGLSQSELAEKAGISNHLMRIIENGAKSSESVRIKIFQVLLDVEDKTLETIIDWLNIQFQTNDFELIIEKVLMLDKNSLLNVENGMMNYKGYYEFGAIKIHYSNEGSKQGTLISMSGLACRQFENLLKEQNREWRDFVITAKNNGGRATRIDLAINDYTKVLDINEIARKCDKGEFQSRLKKYQIIDEKETKGGKSSGTTIYFGSRKSDFLIRFYEKDREQALKMKTIPELIPIKNRYEMQFRKEKANYVFTEIVKGTNLQKMPYKTLKFYLQFYENNVDVLEGLKPWKPWRDFLGRVKATPIVTDAQEVTYESLYRWIETSCIQAILTLEIVDRINGTMRYAEMKRRGRLKLARKYEKIIDHMTSGTENFISKSWQKEKLERKAYLKEQRKNLEVVDYD